MENLLAFDGQESGEDTFGHTGAENDGVVLLIHLYSVVCGERLERASGVRSMKERKQKARCEANKSSVMLSMLH